MLKTAVRLAHPRARSLRWLAEDFIFYLPFLGAFMNRIGAVRACQENAERLLQQGRLVAVSRGREGDGQALPGPIQTVASVRRSVPQEIRRGSGVSRPIELPVEGSAEKKWVLIINRNPGAPAGGTGVRYLIGKFDGVNFTSEIPDTPALWADWGKDFYATNTWKDTPASDGRHMWIGWFSNWQYANAEPTVLWRGAQSIPRSLMLRRYGDGLRLVQRPVRELESLRREKVRMVNVSVAEANQKLSGMKSEIYEFEAELEPGHVGEIGFRLRRVRRPRPWWALTPSIARFLWIGPARARFRSARTFPDASPPR